MFYICLSRGFILDLGGMGVLLFHFILSKIVASKLTQWELVIKGIMSPGEHACWG